MEDEMLVRSPFKEIVLVNEAKSRLGQPGNEFYKGREYPWPDKYGGPIKETGIFFDMEGVLFNVQKWNRDDPKDGYLVTCFDCPASLVKFLEKDANRPSHCIDEHLRTAHEPKAGTRKTNEGETVNQERLAQRLPQAKIVTVEHKGYTMRFPESLDGGVVVSLRGRESIPFDAGLLSAFLESQQTKSDKPRCRKCNGGDTKVVGLHCLDCDRISVWEAK